MTERCFIIQKDRSFLVGVPYPKTQQTRWSASKYDAVRFAFHEEFKAQKVAEKVGGRLVIFNTLTGVIS